MSAIGLRPNPAGQLEVRGRDQMLVAVKTATVRDEHGQPEQLTAGMSRVRAGHYLTTTYPELFGPERVTAGRRSKRTRAATRAPARPLHVPAPSPPPWKPLVRLDTRLAPTTFTVQLSERAYRSMGDQAYAQRGRVETGGALFGEPARESDGKVTVIRAGEPGPKARTSASRMRVDVDHVRREAIELQRADGPVGWVGSWHTHPNVDRGRPSDSDLAFFAWDCRELHHLGRSMQHYIGLILTPNWDHDSISYERYASWARPTITAWHMNAVADDQFICTRAEVVRL